MKEDLDLMENLKLVLIFLKRAQKKNGCDER
jgi:hypothetical protein